MNIYELNKAGYANLPSLTPEQIEASKPALIQFLTTFSSRYYMLVNNESHYYTLFTYGGLSNIETLADEILSIVKELGEIKSIERNKRMMEFWIVDKVDKECRLYPFFDYSRGVIEVE